jgi:hypothetical protein
VAAAVVLSRLDQQGPVEPAGVGQDPQQLPWQHQELPILEVVAVVGSRAVRDSIMVVERVDPV